MNITGVRIPLIVKSGGAHANKGKGSKVKIRALAAQ